MPGNAPAPRHEAAAAVVARAGQAAPATIAADLFRQRQAAARRMVAAGKWALPQAEARLAPWAAIAAACGADLPELRYESRAVYPYARAGQVDHLRLTAAEICPRAAMLAELAQCTAAALAADWRSPASQALLALHLHFADRAELPGDRRHEAPLAGSEETRAAISPVDHQGLAA